MKLTTLIIFLAPMSVAQLARVPDPGPTLLMSGATGFNSGVSVHFAAYAIPGGDKLGYGEGGMMDDVSSVHRFMVDPVTRESIGYDLSITGDAARGYQATFRPLSKSMLPGSRIVSPRVPAPQPVKDGDTIFVELMTSPDGVQHVVDYIQIVLPKPDLAPASTQTPPRDFTIDDGPVTFDTSRMTFWIDGQRWPGITGFTGKPGATFWLSVPGAGRYILSTVPHDGMTRNGSVRDHVMSFEDGGHKYEVRFASPIAGAGKAWNLYVSHDPSYVSRMPDGISSGIDRYENLSLKH